MKKKLREVRLKKGFSQEELADLIGMTQCNYSRRENGKKGISDTEWTRISKVLKIDKDEIYEPNSFTIIHDDEVNIPSFNIPQIILQQMEILKNENTILKEKLKFFESFDNNKY
jgi:transcriptional regulator with XRE-family HTH domain